MSFKEGNTVNPYDLAHQLAHALAQSDEYQQFQALKERINADENAKKMVDAYKKEQFKMQAAVLSGKPADPELMENLKRMGLVMQYNQDISAYLMAEYRMNQLMSDIFKILGDAVQIDLGFLENQEG
nr:YlbF family regulator [Luoshenia tenuis]